MHSYWNDLADEFQTPHASASVPSQVPSGAAPTLDHTAIEFSEAEFGASARNAAPPRGGLEWISWRPAGRIWTSGARLTFPL
jgi:hypothetical protein